MGLRVHLQPSPNSIRSKRTCEEVSHKKCGERARRPERRADYREEHPEKGSGREGTGRKQVHGEARTVDHEGDVLEELPTLASIRQHVKEPCSTPSLCHGVDFISAQRENHHEL